MKELFWVVQRDSFVDCSYPAWLGAVNGQQPFNYSDDFSTEGVITDLLSAGGTATATQTTVTANAGTLPLGGASLVGTALGSGTASDNMNFDSGVNYLLAKVILASGVRCEGKNPVEVAKLQLNGQDRFTEREGSYFDKVQPYQHHSRTPSTGINVYSFALRPEEHQPSGTCNFSRIDKATLQLTVSLNTVVNSNTAQVRV